jgi:hypothetical protein
MTDENTVTTNEINGNAGKTTVVFPDGETKTFSSIGRIFTSSSVAEDNSSIKVKAYLKNGELISHIQPLSTPEQIAYAFVRAGRGLEEGLKASLTGITKFADTINGNGEVTEKSIQTVLAETFQDFTELKYTVRNVGSGVQEPFTLLEKAYMLSKSLDSSDPAVYTEVKEWSKGLTKEERTALASPSGDLYLNIWKFKICNGRK